MNKTKIDWCDSTWNPVTGCLHECKYCYARGIAERFGGKQKYANIFEENEPVIGTDGKALAYPHSFSPTLLRYRLNDYINKKSRNIFVCSMADLFGSWVPDSWIEEVFKACEKAPQHNYLFLTKNPKRYEKILDRYMPPSMWFGWSQTGPMGHECDFETHHSVKTFISIEPLLTPFEEFHIKGVDWVIIGAETGRRKDKVIPEREWIKSIVNECIKNDIPVFMKSSLAEIWCKPLMQEFPKELKTGRSD
ncbi:MAG: phage Gp37/Gp68 family protein [Lachnospiraceae bacterium]